MSHVHISWQDKVFSRPCKSLLVCNVISDRSSLFLLCKCLIAACSVHPLVSGKQTSHSWDVQTSPDTPPLCLDILTVGGGCLQFERFNFPVFRSLSPALPERNRKLNLKLPPCGHCLASHDVRLRNKLWKTLKSFYWLLSHNPSPLLTHLLLLWPTR